MQLVSMVCGQQGNRTCGKQVTEYNNDGAAVCIYIRKVVYAYIYSVYYLEIVGWRSQTDDAAGIHVQQ
jgi:hypothetical protein